MGYENFLKKVAIFKDLNRAELKELSRIAVKKHFPKGRRIFREGSRALGLYIIFRGFVRIVIGDNAGREVMLALMKRGDVFGEVALIDGGNRSAGAVTDTAVDLIWIHTKDFDRVSHRNPQIAIQTLKQLARRLRESDRRIASLVFLDNYGKVACALRDLALTEGHSDPKGFFSLPRKSPKEIALLVGVSVQSARNVMSDLERQGILNISKDRMILGVGFRG